MDFLEELNFVLNFMNTEFDAWPYISHSGACESINRGCEKDNKVIDDIDLWRIFKKLEGDGYIYSELKSVGLRGVQIEHYYITYDGKMFIYRGGYVQQESDRQSLLVEQENLKTLEKRLKEKAMEQNRQLIFAGAFAAVFSGGILILELVKYYDKPEVGRLELILWVGIAILCLLLRKAIVKIFP